MKRHVRLTGAAVVAACAFATGTATGQAPVELGDISTEQFDSYSELRANVQRRLVMAHNITFKRVINKDALKSVHTCGLKFRLPYLPTVTNADENAQTFEAGMFAWDGEKTRLDYGTAFQWVLNPWADNFGDILCWTDIEGGK